MNSKHLESCTKCPKCEKILNKQMKNHENPYGYFCEFCNQRLPSYNALEIHIRSKHFHEEGSFACDKCDKRFILKSKLTVHKRDTHSKRIYCQFVGCEKSYKSESAISYHYKKDHLNVAKFVQCDLCDFKTRTRAYLIPHMNMKHLNIKPYKCEICVYSSVNKDALRNHMKYNHGPAIKCETCEKVFKSGQGLRNHMKMHENPNGYFCEICKKRHQTYDALEIHIRSEVRTF